MTSPSIYAFRRAQLEARIEEMIALLDELDGGSDDEPELGWCGNGIGWREGEPLDEADDEREPNGDELDTSLTEDDYSVRLF